jgi:site-specific recombinase XerD
VGGDFIPHFHKNYPTASRFDVDEMGRPARLPDPVRGQDLKDVISLWRKLGHTPKSIAQYQIAVIEILKRGRAFDYHEITADRVDSWAQQYAVEHGLEPAAVMRRWLPAFRAFAWGLKQVGKSTGSVVRSKTQLAVDSTVDAFMEYGRSLGWKERTLFLHLRSLRELKHHVVGHRGKWPEPRLKDVDDFLMAAAKRWKRTTVAGAAGTFRAWFRFLFVTGRSKQNMAESVILPPSIRYARPPRALPWNTVRRLSRGIDTSTAIGRRDMAQYRLFCAYGLSNAEVTNLKLEDIDWSARVLHIRRLKNGSTLDLPLSPSVAKAIAAYIRHGRPSTECRQVFVGHCIPFGPLGKSTIGQRVKSWAERADVRAPYLGVHVFRHSFATYQMERGVSLKLICDILGHRSTQTTSIYVRSALGRLRQLALPVPK